MPYLWKHLCFKETKKNYNHARKCSDFAADILLICGLDISKEKDDMFSKYLCVKCSATIYAIRKNRSLTSIKRTKETFLKAMDIWCEFQPTSLDMCKLCSHRQSLTRGFFKPTCATSSPSATTPEPAASTSHTKKPQQPAQSFHNYQTIDHHFIEETVHTEMDNLNQPNFTQFDTDHTSLDHTDSVASTSVNPFVPYMTYDVRHIFFIKYSDKMPYMTYDVRHAFCAKMPYMTYSVRHDISIE